MPETIPDHLSLRFGQAERAAIAAVRAHIAHPLRSAPTVSEAIRAAVLLGASTISATEAAR